MSVLKSVIVDTKKAWIKFPGISEFEVELATISRPKLMEMRKRCMHAKFDKKLRISTETLDEEQFLAEFGKAAIKNWRGLTLGKLEDLLPVELGDADPNTEVPFSTEDALMLLKNSPDFETWVNDSVFDLENFRSGD